MSQLSPDALNRPYAYEQLDDPLVVDTITDFSGGEDDFHRAILLNANQCQMLVNVMVRDNYQAKTRPGADKLVTGAVTPDVAVCKGLWFFNRPGVEQLIAGFNGKLWQYSAGAWAQITTGVPAGFPTAGNRLAMAQGVDLMLIGDGDASHNLCSYDGTTVTPLNGAPGSTNAPKGASILCWHTSRMIAAGVPGATTNGGAANYPDQVYVSNLLSFQDTEWDLNARAFRVGAGDGQPIIGLASLQNFNLCVFKSNSIWIVQMDPALDNNTNFTMPNSAPAQVQQILSEDNIGLVGRDAWCEVGNDVLFMAQDGVRSVQRMLAAVGQSQVSPPISQPVQAYIYRINQAAWSGVVAKKYQEFAFFFVPLDNSLTNNCVLVYNTRLQSWMGAWLGWNGQAAEVTRFGTNVGSAQEHFVYGGLVGDVNQWKDAAALADIDSTYTDNAAPIATTIIPRSFTGGEFFNDKQAYGAITRFTAGNALVTATFFGDLTQMAQWQVIVTPSGDILGVGTLPFLLESSTPSVDKHGLRGVGVAYNECYIQLTTTSGWIQVRSVQLAQFINPLAGL